MPEMEAKERGSFESTGAKYGGEILFECFACGAPLADIIISYANTPITWNMVAECPHCGERSYEKQIEGNFCIGESENTRKYTKVVDYDSDSDPIIIKTMKVGDYVQKRS